MAPAGWPGAGPDAARVEPAPRARVWIATLTTD